MAILLAALVVAPVRAQIVDPNEELFDRTEDDRRLRSPAIRIGMPVAFGREQCAAFTQDLDDLSVGVENIFADQLRNADFLGESAVIVDRPGNAVGLIGQRHRYVVVED